MNTENLKPRVLQSKEYTGTQKFYYALFRELPEQDIDPADIPELMSIIRDALSMREKIALTHRFGLACKKMTRKVTSATFFGGVDEACIQNLEQKALRKLKNNDHGRIKSFFRLQGRIEPTT